MHKAIGRKAISMLLATFMAATAWAAEAPEAERQKLAEDYFRVSGYEDMYNDKKKVEEMISSQMYSLEQSLLPQMTPEQAAEYRRQMAAMRPDINRIIGTTLDAMRPDMIKVVAETYTAEELRAMVAFYSSESGRKIVAKNPQLMNQMMAIGGRHMGGMMKSMQKLVADRMQQSANAASGSGKGK
jgi:hypothetical protein